MRVCLVYCAIGVAGFNPNRQPGDREGSWIGHGVASIGAQVKAKGHEVTLIDLRQLSGWDDLAAIVEANPADVYGLSVAPIDYYAALKAVFEIKTHAPSAKIIVGGIHPTMFPEQYDFMVIDTIVRGEGEITFPRLLEQLDSLPKVIQGEKPVLDDLKWADRDLFQYDLELTCTQAPGHPTPSITMLAGRGCPYHCSYCQPAENSVFGTPFRIRSAVDVIEEMIALYSKYEYRSVSFWDDTFTVSPKWVKEFCGLYRESGIGAKIAACSRADLICRNPGMVEDLAAAGVDWLVIGFESGSQRLLELICKGTTVEQNIEAARICRANGIKVFGTYMYGLPTETPEESTATARMIDEISPDHASPFWFLPIPGTGLHEYCVTHGLILDDQRTIERTGHFVPSLKGIDYDHISKIMGGSNA